MIALNISFFPLDILQNLKIESQTLNPRSIDISYLELNYVTHDVVTAIVVNSGGKQVIFRLLD